MSSIFWRVWCAVCGFALSWRKITGIRRFRRARRVFSSCSQYTSLLTVFPFSKSSQKIGPRLSYHTQSIAFFARKSFLGVCPGFSTPHGVYHSQMQSIFHHKSRHIQKKAFGDVCATIWSQFQCVFVFGLLWALLEPNDFWATFFLKKESAPH